MMSDLPQGTYVANMELTPQEVGQEVLNYPFSGRVDTIERGPTIWQANLTLITEQGSERYYMAWAQSLRGAIGTFKVPLERKRNFAPQNHSGYVKRQLVEVLSATTGNFGLMTDPTDGMAGDDDYDPALHDFINVNERLLRVSLVSGGLLNTSPRYPGLKVGDTVEVAEPYLKCRLRAGTTPVMSMSGSGNNVQTISVVEAI